MMRTSQCGHAAIVAAIAMLAAGCSSTPAPRFNDGVPASYDVPPPPPFAAKTAPAPYDSFDNGPLLATPAFTRTSPVDSEQQRTAELLAQEQRPTMVVEGRSSPSLQPLDGSAPTQGVRTYPVTGGSAYWNNAPMAWGSPSNTTDGPGTVVTDAAQHAPYAGGVSSVEPIRSGPLTVPETLSTDPDSVGTGGASIPPPPDAKAGECFALVRKPALYRTTQRDFELRPPADRLQIEPARYVTETQTVTIQDAYEKLEVIPATFHIVTEQVEVAPATTRYVASEPVYQSVTERVEERPARSVWKFGRGKIEKVDNATGQIMCLVEEPAVYRTVTRQVLKEPAQMREITVPAQTRTITRRVIDRPEQVRRVMVPAEQATLPVNRVVQNAEVTRVPVPGQIASYGVKELVSPAELEWRPVLCETNMTPDVIRRVQVQLTAIGFEPGPANGQMNPQTIAALNAYQRQRGLPEDRYLNVETARALGVWQ
jgi:hypothetical protein